MHKFSRKIPPGDPRRAFPTSVVVSHLDKEFLPFQVSTDAPLLCEIKSDLTGADENKFKLKNRHWWQFNKAKYFRVDYQIRVLIGPADINFELCECFSLRTGLSWGSAFANSWTGFDGQKLSRDNPITVEWQAIAAPEPVMNNIEPEVFRNVAQNNFSMSNLKGFSMPNVINLSRVPVGSR
jgi:hypothetical protein